MRRAELAVGVYWTLELDSQSSAEGWALFQTDGPGHPPWELERIDGPEDGSDPIFKNDREAHEFVRRQAEAGDDLALAAVAFLKEHSPEEYDTLTNSKHENWD